MTWWVTLLLFLAVLMVLMILGTPIAFAFLIVNLGAAILLFNINAGPAMMVRSMYAGLASFTLLPIALFVLMGEVLFQSGVATQTLDAMSKWLGAIPGRLAVLAVATGTILAALSGSALATTAMLGSLLVPEMVRRGYSKQLSAGSILAAGSLAMVIPPSNVAVLVGTLGDISIGKLLIGGIVPGLMLAAGNIGYIMLRAYFKPTDAPVYHVDPTPWSQRLLSLVRDILPLTILMFLAVGVIIVGVATPTEAAALGATGAFLLAAAYGRLNWEVARKSLAGTIRVAGMLLLIMAMAGGFSQFLSYTGATRRLVQIVTQLTVPTMVILAAMMLLVFVMGCFLEQVAILMITLPLFMPVVNAMGVDTVWFGLLMLLNVDLANLTPPFGLALFVMKGVTPKEFSLRDIIYGALPFMIVEAAVIAALMAFPTLVTYVPNALMR